MRCVAACDSSLSEARPRGRLYRDGMTAEQHAELPAGPILFCARPDADAAARLAEAAAALLAGRPVVVLAIWERAPSGGDAVLEALADAHDLRTAVRHQAADAAGAACEVLDARGLDVTRRVCADERAPWHVILDVADELDAAAIVAGAGDPAHPGAIGRQVRALAHRSQRPLLVLPADAEPVAADAPALFAYDGSAPADEAIRAAVRLLTPRPALAACVWQSATYAAGAAMLAVPDEIARKGAARLDEAARGEAESHAEHGAELLRDAAWTSDVLALETARSVPGAIIIAADDHDAAVIVTGTRGRSRVAAVLLGSSAEGILRHAGRPVLLVPPADARDPHDASA